MLMEKGRICDIFAICVLLPYFELRKITCVFHLCIIKRIFLVIFSLLNAIFTLFIVKYIGIVNKQQEIMFTNQRFQLLIIKTTWLQKLTKSEINTKQ